MATTSVIQQDTIDTTNTTTSSYYMLIKAGIHKPWEISSYPMNHHTYSTSTSSISSTTIQNVVCQYNLPYQFNIHIHRHQYKIYWYFGIVCIQHSPTQSNHSQITSLLHYLNNTPDLTIGQINEQSQIIMLCMLRRSILKNTIKKTLDKLRRYYSSTTHSTITKFQYLKQPMYSAFMLDLQIFEDSIDSDFDFDISLNTTKKFSVSFTKPYFQYKITNTDTDTNTDITI
jgi:hypothetical protein